MFRLVKYYNPYESYKASFSNVSTEYEVLPVVSESGSLEALKRYAKENGLKVSKKEAETDVRHWQQKISTAIRLTELSEVKRTSEKRPTYLGWYKIDVSGPLAIDINCNGVVTEEDVFETYNCQSYGIVDSDTIDSVKIIIMDSWDAYHDLKMLGYSREQFSEAAGVDLDDWVFDDSVFSCDECGEYDWNDDGYTYNYRIVDKCTLLGVNCGCHDKHLEENYKKYIDDPDVCLEAGVAETLELDGTIEFCERFIGGMTDGRGGSYNGESVREGTPKEVLKEYKNDNPDESYVFVRDESGQFQTYFSIYLVK